MIEIRSKPFLEARQFWLIITAISIVLASLSSFTTYANARVTGRTNWREALFAASLWLVFGPLTWIPYILARRFPLRREDIVRTISAHIGGTAAMCLFWTLLGILLVRLITTRPAVPFQRYFASSLLTNLSLCVFFYFAVLGCIHAVTYYREARERQQRESRLAAQLSEARLSALRMQLNPHFLFNSLNAITVLVRDHKSDDAVQMLELLSDVLREVLRNRKNAETNLGEELAFIEKYLTIEQVRFSDRLQVHWSIEPATRDVLVPEFLLQPLVENAIRHGIDHRTSGGVIEITAKESDGKMALTVRNNGPAYRPVTTNGLGLTNTRERLATLYGDDGQLILAPDEGGGTIASVHFPARRPG